MPTSPHTPENIAKARDALTDLARLANCSPEIRFQLAVRALAILHTDRICRLGLDASTPQGPARVIRIPLAVFQAGRRSACVHRMVIARPTTPGDAA